MGPNSQLYAQIHANPGKHSCLDTGSDHDKQDALKQMPFFFCRVQMSGKVSGYCTDHDKQDGCDAGAGRFCRVGTSGKAPSLLMLP